MQKVFRQRATHIVPQEHVLRHSQDLWMLLHSQRSRPSGLLVLPAVVKVLSLHGDRPSMLKSNEGTCSRLGHLLQQPSGGGREEPAGSKRSLHRAAHCRPKPRRQQPPPQKGRLHRSPRPVSIIVPCFTMRYSNGRGRPSKRLRLWLAVLETVLRIRTVCRKKLNRRRSLKKPQWSVSHAGLVIDSVQQLFAKGILRKGTSATQDGNGPGSAGTSFQAGGRREGSAA